MGIWDLTQKSFDVFAKNMMIALPLIIFAVVVIILALLVIGSIFVSLIPSLYSMSSMSSFSASLILPLLLAGLPALIIFFILTFLACVLIEGMYISIGKQAALNKKPDLGVAYKEAKSRYLSLLGADIIAGLMALLAALILISLFIAARGLGVVHITLAVIGVLLIVILGFTLAALFFMVPAAVIIEGRSALESVKRSIQIGTANFWSIILLILIFLGLRIILGLIGIVPILGWVIAIVGSIILDIMFLIIPSLFYYQYVRRPSPAKKAKPKRKR